MMRTVRPGATHERRPDDEDEEDDDDDDDELDAGMAVEDDEDDDADADSAPYLASKSAFLLELLPLLPCFDFSRCLPSLSRPSR